MVPGVREDERPTQLSQLPGASLVPHYARDHRHTADRLRLSAIRFGTVLSRSRHSHADELPNELLEEPAVHCELRERTEHGKFI